MTREDLIAINSMSARARRHLREFDHSGEPSDYWQYFTLWKELKEVYSFEMPAYKGYTPTGPVKPVPAA